MVERKIAEYYIEKEGATDIQLYMCTENGLALCKPVLEDENKVKYLVETERLYLSCRNMTKAMGDTDLVFLYTISYVSNTEHLIIMRVAVNLNSQVFADKVTLGKIVSVLNSMGQLPFSLFTDMEWLQSISKKKEESNEKDMENGYIR